MRDALWFRSILNRDKSPEKAGLESTLLSRLAIYTFLVIHLFCSPKFCTGLILNYSYDDCDAQEKLKTKVIWLCKIWVGRGGRGKEAGIMEDVQMLNWPIRTSKQHLLMITQLKKQKSNDTRTKHGRKTTQDEKTGSCKPCGLLMT